MSVDEKNEVPHSSEPPDVSEDELKERPTETDPEQKTPDFRSEKPRKSVDEEDLVPSKMTKSEKKRKESARKKSIEPYEVTKPEFPDRKLRKSKEEAETTEEFQVKSTQQVGTEQDKFPDKKLKKSTKKRASEPLEEFNLQHFGEESRTLIDEASLELSEKRTSKASKKAHKSSFDANFPGMLEEITLALLEEIKPDVEDESQDTSTKEKVPEPVGDKKPITQKHRQRRPSGLPKLKGSLTEPSQEKEPVLQAHTEPEFTKEKLIKSMEKTDYEPPQTTDLDIPEKSELEQTIEKSLKLPSEPKPGGEGQFPKEDRPGPSKLKYPIGKDDLIFSEYQKKLSEKKSTKSKNDYVVGSPRESVESAGSVYETQEFLRDLQDDMNELFTAVPDLEASTELRDSLVFPQDVDILGGKESQINPSLRPQFEHLTWSPERVAEWISDLGYPQYKECFTENFISGQKLIHVNCSNLPQMGITDFEDMKAISYHVRVLLGIEEPLFSRSICLPYRDNIGLFLERKGHSGVKSDALTFSEFVEASGLQEYSAEVSGSQETSPEVKATDKSENSSLDESDIIIQI